MLPAHPQPHLSAAAVALSREEESAVSVNYSDNAWLLSFIDILALLLTLFVLLLAYETNEPREADRRAPLSQPEPSKPSLTARSQDPLKQARLQLAMPFELFENPRRPALHAPPRRERGLPAVIDLPVVAAAVPRPAPPASGNRQAPSEAPSSPDTAADEKRVQPAAQTAPAGQPADSMPATPTAMADAAPSVSPRDALLDALADSPLRERVEVTVHSDAVSLEISDSILFEPASAALTADGSGLLGELAVQLAEHPYRLSVEGHTDNVPIRTSRFPSNWELSSARAAMVTRELIARGVPAGRVRAVGYGDTRPRADNATAQGRARNRRVSFVLRLPSPERVGVQDH